MFNPDNHLLAQLIRCNRNYATHGEWWLPGNPDRRFGGNLTWRPDSGGTVFCAGHLLSQGGWPMAQSAVIHGQTAGKCPVSLIWPLSYREGREPAGQEIKIWGLLVGGNIESTDACGVASLSLDFNGLTEWATDSPIKLDCTPGPDDPPTTLRTILLVDMNSANFGPLSSIGATCSMSASGGQSGLGYKVTHVARRRIGFHFDSPTSLSKAISLSWKLELLFTLLTGSPTLVRSMHLHPPNASFRDEQAFLGTRTWKPQKRFYARQLMPVRFENVADRFTSILNSWFALYDRLGPVLNLLAVALFRGPDRFYEDRFLGVAQAAEGYCRILWPDTYANKDDFNAIIPELLQTIEQVKSPLLSQKAANSLKYQNEFSFRDRLLKLFDREPWLIPLLGKGSDDSTAKVRAFVSSVVGNRNALTHVDSPKEKRKPINDATSRTLRAVLCSSILEKIGVSPTLYESFVKNNVHDMWW